MGNLAILVPVHNRLVYTKRFIECLKKNTYKAWTLFVVDDGSTDGTDQMLKKISIETNTDDQVRLLDETIYHIRGDGNWWWTKSVNAIAHVALRSGASLILTQNNDVEIPPDYLERLVEANSIYPHAIITAPIFDLNTGDCLPNGGGVRRKWLTAKDIKFPDLEMSQG